MALINCPECGEKISDKAKKCVHCGKAFESLGDATKEIVCNECGASIQTTENECPNCGCPIEQKVEKKLNKKTIMILSALLGIIIIVCVGSAIYNSTPVQKHIAEAEEKRATLNASEIAFQEAKKAEDNGDIELAIKKYKAVISEDKSYAKAQSKIKELQDTYKNKLLLEAENFASNKKYKEAIQNVEKIISTLGSSEELIELKQKYLDLKASQYASIKVADKTVTHKDSSKWIFSNYVNFVFEVTNNSDKDIKGIEGTLNISDLFGKDIISMGCDFTGKTIKVGETITFKDLSFECNEFMDKHMKLFNTAYSDLQFSYDIKSIVYTDGSTVVPE